jgi:hypothetical protein
MRLTFGTLFNRGITGNYTLTVAVAGVNVTRISITVPAINTGTAVLAGLSGAVVSPTSIASGLYYDKNPANKFIPITVDIPYSLFDDYSYTGLVLTHEPCAGVFHVNKFAVNACVLETCGKQISPAPG